MVILDVIARDKKGRPVRDLKAEELQVFENDQRCEIRSFRLVESEGTLEQAGTGTGGRRRDPCRTAAHGRGGRGHRTTGPAQPRDDASSTG